MKNKKEPKVQKEQNKQKKAGKTSKTVKPDATKTDPSDDVRQLILEECKRSQRMEELLIEIRNLLKEISANQINWPFELHDRGYNDKPGWDRNTTPPDDPPSTIHWPAHPPGAPRWPTDPWGNPIPYAVYCDYNERMR